MTSLRIVQFALWSTVLMVGTAAATIYLVRPPMTSPSAPVISDGESSLGKAPYELLDTSGRPFNRATITGSPTLLFFGFTQCPDICPTTLADITRWYEQLGAEAAELQSYFISIDPERDSKQRLVEYLSWSDRIVGVTGTPEQIAEAARSWGIFYEKVPEDDGGYTMDHTSAVYLVDRSGEFVTSISYDEDTSEALGKLRDLLGS